jgi:propionyl-CoA carboxylase alpha chain
MRYLVSIGEDTVELEVERDPDGAYRVRGSGGPELRVTALSSTAGLIDLSIDGQSVRVQSDNAEVRFRHTRYVARAENWLERARAHSGASNGAQSRKLVASMPGRIVQVLCEAGKAVTLGTPLIVMEAMKMQNELRAKSDGMVRSVRVSVGQTVERGELLVEFE